MGVIEDSGQIVAGRYRVIRPLGRGGMGEVFLAQQLNLNRLVVIKRVLPARAGGNEIQALLAEARVAARLQHPNIVSIIDVSRDGETPFVVMEYLPGVSLREMIERAVPRAIPIDVAIAIALDLLRGLAYAHGVRTGRRHGVVHRDVKPRNVMVTFAGVTKLIDFGISRWLDDTAGDSPLTGTHGYMAPEQYEGGRATGASDQYAVAVTLYEMLTGALPSGGDVTLAARPSMMTASEPLVAIDAQLEPIVERARSVAPADRFADCAAMAEVLEAIARTRGLVPSAAAVERWMLRKFPREHAASEREFAGLAEAAEVRDATHVADPAIAPTNLAPPVDGFVGRDDDLGALDERFAAGARLVTLLGPPGIGKTRLAREHAWRSREGFAGGAWFADLTEARTADGVVVDIATALGVPGLDATLDGMVRQLGAAIAHRGSVLIVVDNFEQVVDHAAATLGRLADLAPSARWLVTSRERLNLPIEIAVELGPLTATGDTLSLLVERARVARPGIALGRPELDELAVVAERLEGNPLAIELAAGKLKLLSPRQLRDRLASGFDVLTGRRRGVPERQTAFDKAIEWSWQMLEPWERDALAQAAIFRGGFSIAAAEAVIDLGDHAAAPPVIDVLESLGDKSLLRRITAGELPDEPRFGMYEGIRSFARARLDATPAAAAKARARHADHFLAYAETWSAADRYPAVRDRARHLGAERENIWQLVEPVLAGTPSAGAVAIALRALVTLVPIYEGRGLRSMFARVFDAVLDGEHAVPSNVPPRVLSTAWRERCRVAPRNQIDVAWKHVERAFAIARDHGLREELAWAVIRGLPLTSDRRDPASRDAMIGEATARFVGSDPDDRDWRALATSLLISFQKVDDSDPSRLAAIVDDLGATAATSQRPGVLAHIHWALGVHQLVTGDLERAQTHLRRVVALYEETDDDQPSLALARGNVAAMAIGLDRDLDDALRLAELSRRSLLEMGLTVSVPFNDFNLALIREGLGDLAGAEVEARRCVDRQSAAGPGSNWLLRGDTGVVAARGQLAIVQSQLGRADDADRTLADAVACAAAWETGDAPYSSSVMEAARAILDAARAQLALARGGVVAARRHLAAARARDGAAWSDEVMVILRRVQRRLDDSTSV